MGKVDIKQKNEQTKTKYYVVLASFIYEFEDFRGTIFFVDLLIF